MRFTAWDTHTRTHAYICMPVCVCVYLTQFLLISPWQCHADCLPAVDVIRASEREREKPILKCVCCLLISSRFALVYFSQPHPTPPCSSLKQRLQLTFISLASWLRTIRNRCGSRDKALMWGCRCCCWRMLLELCMMLHSYDFRVPAVESPSPHLSNFVTYDRKVFRAGDKQLTCFFSLLFSSHLSQTYQPQLWMKSRKLWQSIPSIYSI